MNAVIWKLGSTGEEGSSNRPGSMRIVSIISNSARSNHSDTNLWFSTLSNSDNDPASLQNLFLAYALPYEKLPSSQFCATCSNLQRNIHVVSLELGLSVRILGPKTEPRFKIETRLVSITIVTFPHSLVRLSTSIQKISYSYSITAG